MKRYGAFILVLCVIIVSFPAVPLFATTPTISITASRTVMVPGQEVTITVTVSPEGTNYSLDYDDGIPNSTYAVLEEPNEQHPNTAIARNKGTVVITATINGTDIKASVTIKVRTPTGLISGEDYYIMNSATRKYLSLTSANDSNNVRVVGRDRGTQVYSRWTANITEVTATNNQINYTRLTSAYSSTGRNMYVSGTNLVIYNSTGARTTFAVHRIESGDYQGQYAIRYGDQYVAMNSSGTVYLTTSSSDNIYWTFMAVEKGEADITSNNYTYTDENGSTRTFNSTANNHDFIDVFNGFGYSAYATVNYQAQYSYLYMRTHDDIYIFCGHGNAGIISFNTTGNISTGAIAINSYVVSCYPNIGSDRQYIGPLNNYTPLDYSKFAKLRCVMYLGCLTGNDITTLGDTYNLVDSTFAQGAHFVLGTTESIDNDDADEWLGYFLERLTDESCDYTIEEACNYASYRLGPITITNKKSNGTTIEKTVASFPIYTRGDGNQYLQ